MKKLFKILGILVAKYGDHILIKPTMRCNLNCEYCVVNKTTGKRPMYWEVPYGHWSAMLIIRQPQVVTISGGEPLLYRNIDRIIDYLTARRIFVMVSTNLMSLNGLNITPSKYLWFYSTNHKSNQKVFERNLRIYRGSGYGVSVKEFGERTIKGSHLGVLKDEQTTDKIEVYAPDLRKFNSWIELEENGIK